ncbi:hypothetical protein K501DRAFT_273033 [Backusella circina FSU 941]|nr:hypothetical protein K501DRAFT_273033 [Backusella circina FSU 941]
MNKIGIQYALNMGTLSTAWTGNKQANISCYSSLTLLFWKGSGSGQVINTKIPSHEVATSEQGLPQSMVSITPVSIGREYMIYIRCKLERMAETQLSKNTAFKEITLFIYHSIY